MKNQIKSQLYGQKLEQTFQNCFAENRDSTPQLALYEDLTDREQILFMTYEMEKKGKNFGISESRTFKIEGKQFYQVNKNKQQKLLPYPKQIQIEYKDSLKKQWDNKQEYYEARLLLKFQQRSDIYIYFKSKIECNQISMYLLSLIRQKQGKYFNILAHKYKQILVTYVVVRIKQAKNSKQDITQIKMRSKIYDLLCNKYGDCNILSNFLSIWKSKSLFNEIQENFTISLISLQSMESSLIGDIIILAGGSIHKKIKITQNNTKIIQKHSFFQFQFNEQFLFEFKAIPSHKQLQFEIQIQIGNKIWKGYKFCAIDLKKLVKQYNMMQLTLKNKEQIKVLRFRVEFESYSNEFKQKIITPLHYRLIDQLYSLESPKYQLSQIHQYYSNIYNTFYKSTPFYLYFNQLTFIFEHLKIQQLIQKFYLVFPFNQYVNVQLKGSFVYNYLLKEEKKNKFYDVEKLMWKFKENKYKSILTALKIFDQNPKFNFTEPFFYLCKKSYELAYLQSLSNWKSELFEKNYRGIQSVAFFIALAIIKTFQGIFMHQQFTNKRALSINSLLFHFVIKNCLPFIYQKILRLQLNIQAFFGQQFVNLFSRLFKGNIYFKILQRVLQQKRAYRQSLIVNSLIGSFLSIIEMIDIYESTYASAELYILTFEQICATMPDKFQFFSKLDRWKQKSIQMSNTTQFGDLNLDMQQFYLKHAYSGDLGDISQQIYQQFTCYRYKNEADTRKIYLVIDKISIKQKQQTLTLNIYQQANKLYQHEFKGVNLQQLQHFIQLKLLKLDELTIICSTSTFSYSCKIDPKQFPSNYYFHFASSLIVTYQLQPYANNHIFFQAYIKDSCQVDSLENPIPDKYKTHFLQKGIGKDDLAFCRRFNKTFRMRQNNFNLLYLKFGWYGNHYLIPDARILNIEYLSKIDKQVDNLQNSVALIGKYTRTIFGKGFFPYPPEEKDRLSIELIKQGILTRVQSSGASNSNNIQQANQYDSANRLISYVLDNFQIPTSMHFVQFYHKMNVKLPLISYLSYQPLQFYSLPSFTIQVISQSSVCVVIISEKGQTFRTAFQQDQIKQIEENSSFFHKMPSQLQFAYAQTDIFFDDFLTYLRLNILKKVITSNEKRNRINYSADIEKRYKKQTKVKSWPKCLVPIAVQIPNFKLNEFYLVMNQTKQIIQLQYRQLQTMPIDLKYEDWGHIRGRWTPVQCIAVVKSPSFTYYYVVQGYYRKKYFIQSTSFIKASTKNNTFIQTKDQQITNSLEMLTFQLRSLLHF